MKTFREFYNLTEAAEGDMFVVQATVSKAGEGGATAIQVPTFMLDGNIQGITSESHAEQIAKDIINPTKDESIEVNVTVGRQHAVSQSMRKGHWT